MPVRLAARHIFRANRTVGARLVLYNHALAEQRFELVRDKPCNKISWPPRRESDDEAHGSGGKLLRMAGNDKPRQNGESKDGRQTSHIELQNMELPGQPD